MKKRPEREEITLIIESRGAHQRLAKSKPRPELCQRCKERPVEQLSYNNVDKRGYSCNPDDYEWLCMSCHILKDQGSRAIMTKARIHRVREFYSAKAATQRELASLFNVSLGTINNIIKYRCLYLNSMNPEIFGELVESLEKV